MVSSVFARFQRCRRKILMSVLFIVWTVYEQVCIAALDCDRLETSRKCVKLLDARFPNSSRVKRLAGMNLEADGKYVKSINQATSPLLNN